MKNYYLKRIDELKTEVGSDIRSRPVETALKAAAAPFIPGLARKLTRGREKIRRGLDAGRRLKNIQAKKAERLAAKESLRKANQAAAFTAAQGEGKGNRARRRLAQMRANRSPKESLFTRISNKIAARDAEANKRFQKEYEERERLKKLKARAEQPRLKDTEVAGSESSVYTQIGYILAESMGLL